MIFNLKTTLFMKFPKIDYEFWLNNWHKTIGENRVYTNKNMLEFIDYEKEINSCTQEFSSLVNSPKLNKKITTFMQNNY